eukprot:3941737-Rhodomonas_salina.1
MAYSSSIAQVSTAHPVARGTLKQYRTSRTGRDVSTRHSVGSWQRALGQYRASRSTCVGR